MSADGYTQTSYEQHQSFNGLTSWLHSLRYKNIVDVLQTFAANRTTPIRVTEIGCGHGKLFSVLDERFAIDYVGIELESAYIEVARQRHGNRPNCKLIHDSAVTALDASLRPEVIVALETFEHIPEHDVVRLMEKIAELRPSLFICSVPVEIGPAIWAKNLGSLVTGYMRHKEYTWQETLWASLYQLDKLPLHVTSHKGFDWRWLAQTIRHNLKIREIRKFPLQYLPAGCSSSVFIVAEPRV